MHRVRHAGDVGQHREPVIAPDKITHTLAGAAIAAALLPWGVIPALLAVVIAAVGKEVWDAQGHGTPDRIDALATVIGGVLMASWLTLVS